jgi:carbamoyltransferase
MDILGVSAFYHDSAAALLRDGYLIAAASEERFTRKKHDWGFPKHACDYVLHEGGRGIRGVDCVAFYDKPFVKLERMLFTLLATFPRGLKAFNFALSRMLKEQLWIKATLRRQLNWQGDVLFGEHHRSHAASAFLVSPFDEAAILTVDGVGEWSTATRGFGRGRTITLTDEIRFPHSLGLLYSAFTHYLGFKVNSAEYKVMGLAPYGKPAYLDRVRKLVDLRDDGSFALNMDYFSFTHDLGMINEQFCDLFGGPPRPPEGPRLGQREFDLAASVQALTDDIMVGLARGLHEKTGLDNLCLAGGVALNCVSNARILETTPFQRVFIQPAAGDAGGALGVAFDTWCNTLGNPRSFVLEHASWGPQYSTREIRSTLDRFNAVYQELSEPELAEAVARLIDEQHVVGWFQGRMEFGPRALGNRSILADARNPQMKDTLNRKIKFREGFRPFAPSVPAEHAGQWFDPPHDSPFMLLVARVRDDKRTIPSVTHVDGSARLQTVNRNLNPLYYEMLIQFQRRTGCPVVINTSFNVRGEPIVCTPADAYRCFMRTDMDRLAIGPFLLDKHQQPEFHEEKDWKKLFDPD